MLLFTCRYSQPVMTAMIQALREVHSIWFRILPVSGSPALSPAQGTVAVRDTSVCHRIKPLKMHLW